MSIRCHIRHGRSGHFLCVICRESVTLETAKTDDDGQAIHEECYVEKIRGKIPPKPKRGKAVKGIEAASMTPIIRRHADL